MIVFAWEMRKSNRFGLEDIEMFRRHEKNRLFLLETYRDAWKCADWVNSRRYEKKNSSYLLGRSLWFGKYEWVHHFYEKFNKYSVPSCMTAINEQILVNQNINQLLQLAIPSPNRLQSKRLSADKTFFRLRLACTRGWAPFCHVDVRWSAQVCFAWKKTFFRCLLDFAWFCFSFFAVDVTHNLPKRTKLRKESTIWQLMKSIIIIFHYKKTIFKTRRKKKQNWFFYFFFFASRIIFINKREREARKKTGCGCNNNAKFDLLMMIIN